MEQNRMRHWRLLIVAFGMASVFVAAGCGGPEEATLTPAQEAAARHPTADPTYKGPSKEGLEQMNKSIQEYQQKHANDKIEFNTK